MSIIVSLSLFAFFVMQTSLVMAGTLQKSTVLKLETFKTKQLKEEKPHEQEEVAETTLELLEAIAGNAEANAKIIRMLARGCLSKKTRFVKAFFKDCGLAQHLRTAEQDFVLSLLDLLEEPLSEILRNNGEELGFWVLDEDKGFNQVFHDGAFITRKPDTDWDESWDGGAVCSEGVAPDVNESWVDITCKIDADQPAVVSKLGWSSVLNDLKDDNNRSGRGRDSNWSLPICPADKSSPDTRPFLSFACHTNSEPISEGVRRIFEDMIRTCPFAGKIRSAGEDHFDKHKDHINAVLKNKDVTAEQFKEFLFPKNYGHVSSKSSSQTAPEKELGYPSQG